jgi:DNA polymerase-3 subunit delta
LKYQNLLSFEKHLAQAAKVQLSRVFLVVSPCACERKKIVEKILGAIRSKEGEISFQAQEGALSSVEKCIQELNTTSLLAGKQVLYLDESDKIKKNGLALLAEYIDKPSPFSYLLLGASSSKAFADLYAKGKKELVACDLGEEKPWERKERLKRMLVDDASKEGKRLSGEAVEYLLENVGANLPELHSELEKLITFAGERNELTLQDVRALCSAQKDLTLWQLAEAIAWREPFPKLEEIMNLGLLLPLLGQLRKEFQQGLTLSILLARGTLSSDVAHVLPNVKPATLDKMLPQVRARGTPFFKRALDLLFTMELSFKNSGSDPALIFDVFLSKLSLLKRYTQDNSKVGR